MLMDALIRQTNLFTFTEIKDMLVCDLVEILLFTSKRVEEENKAVTNGIPKPK